jgi:hypothetical protein
MRMHALAPAVQISGCGVVRTASALSAPLRERAARSGGLEAAATAALTHEEDAAVVAAALSTLASLPARQPELQLLARRFGVRRAAAAALLRFSAAAAAGDPLANAAAAAARDAAVAVGEPQPGDDDAWAAQQAAAEVATLQAQPVVDPSAGIVATDGEVVSVQEWAARYEKHGKEGIAKLRQ